MPAITYWAHSGEKLVPHSESRLGWQALSAHLEAVASVAGKLAILARPGDDGFARDAELAGLTHDFGKYSDCFQKMILTGKGKCQHAIHGAILNAGEVHQPLYQHISLAIAGHHAGIPDYAGSMTSLAQKLKDAHFCSEASALRARASADSERLRQTLDQLPRIGRLSCDIPAVERDLSVRMLFSCLVDADRLDSAGREPEQAALEAVSRLHTLLDHLDQLSAASPDGVVKSMRAKVLEDCLQAAEYPGNLFSLSVPTGGGKTLAAMAFALRRAVLHPDLFRRIVVVIPYLSIIEQNARVYASVFGDKAVLEHHSGSVMPLKERRETGEEGSFIPGEEDGEDHEYQTTGQRVETENWDAPLIVTTSVRFFESLFSNRPKDLRRAHNIARSIVIFDEVQTLPRRLLSPLLRMQKELADYWGVNFVFATATQPAFEQRGERRNDELWPRGTMQEIVREPEVLRKALVRVRVQWEIEKPVSWDEVALRVMESKQCLTIVNLRVHASELYVKLLDLVRAQGEPEDGVFHLSTRMCAAHRLFVLDRIRERLKAGEPCRVVSTQLIEAGVDVDFPLVMRALGPLDSIVQAAGRADREGKLTASLGGPGGRVIVFLPEDNGMPPHEYKEAAGVTQSLAGERDIQVDNAEAIQAYFERYYNPGDPNMLGSQLNELRGQLKFASLAEQFEYINTRAKDVFVPDDDEARMALDELRRIGQLTWELRLKLQRHTVGLNPTEFSKAHGVLTELRPGSDIWIAVDQAYDENLGLIFAPRLESFVVS